MAKESSPFATAAVRLGRHERIIQQPSPGFKCHFLQIPCANRTCRRPDSGLDASRHDVESVAAIRMNTEAQSPAPRKLNVGCGLDIRSGWVNLDMVDYGGNQIVDLNKYPWPFPDNHFDYIYCSHILEHMGNFNAVVTELFRVGQPDAILEVRVPFFLSTKYYSEPDHRIPFGIRSFDNYEDISGRKLKFYEKWKLGHRTNYGSPARFVVLEKRFHFSNFAVLKWLDFFINLEPVMFERFCAGLLQPEEVIFKLRVSKKPTATAAR